MISKLGALSICMLALAGCNESSISAEQQFIESVAAALSGETAIGTLNTVVIKAKGREFYLGQDMTPESMTMEFVISDHTLAIDLANHSSQTTQTRAPMFNYFLGQDPVQKVFGIDSDVAYDIAADGNARRASSAVAAERRSTYYHHPLTLWFEVLTGKATVSNLTQEEGLYQADIATSGGEVLTIGVDPTTMLPRHIQSIGHHYYLRDALRKTHFADYEVAGGMLLPTSIQQTVDGFETIKLQALTHTINAAINDISVPSGAISAAVPSAPSVDLSVEKVADGVWVLSWRGYNSVVVEFSDHLMLVEAPNEPQTLSALAKARELVPAKPVTQLVSSHHHFDHSGGIRAAISEGLTIITHSSNEAFYRKMARQPSNVVPDRLSQNPRDIDIEVFDDETIYKDDAMTVELYQIKGNPHANSLLMAYLPAQKMVIQADAFTPESSSPQQAAPSLLDNIRRHELEVENILPLHGRTVDIEELKSAVQALGS